MAKLRTVAEAIADQLDSNRSVVGHESTFAAHRARLTAEILVRAPAGGGGRICLLGAGNASDVDLEALAGAFAEVHLVDLDAEAVAGARDRLAPVVSSRVAVHAPFDVSGIFDRLDEWSRVPPTHQAIAEEIAAAAARVVAALPGGFDVVVSCCLITQLQLVLLQVVGDAHPRFEELRSAVGRIHVRALAGLLAPRGVALLVSDLTTNETYPLDLLPPNADLAALMSELLHTGNVIHAAHPGLLSSEIRRDPALKAGFAVRFPIGPWLWRNGPEHTYLVYGLEITTRA